jgi:hypothetical protein
VFISIACWTKSCSEKKNYFSGETKLRNVELLCNFVYIVITIRAPRVDLLENVELFTLIN